MTHSRPARREKATRADLWLLFVEMPLSDVESAAGSEHTPTSYVHCCHGDSVRAAEAVSRATFRY